MEFTRINKMVKFKKIGKCLGQKLLSIFFKVYPSYESFHSRMNPNDIFWMIDNPGKQDQEIMKSKDEGELLRGSFYPLPSIDWEKDAYY
jgi:hypothetical protein